jgi:hypothetical protein
MEVSMRRLFARSTLPLAAAALVLAGGGAYALAASSGTITVCVKHNGGSLYKAKKCKKHDSKLSWNAKGPKGATGATGSQGPQGSQGVQGPQGPGGSILTYDATASASPTPKVFATVNGDTFSGACALSSGNAQTDLLIQTTDGSWKMDFATDEPTGNIVNSINVPAGTLTTPGTVAQASAASPAHISINQLGPAPGYQVWHLSATDSGSSHTCHISLMSFPTTLTAVAGSGASGTASTHVPLLTTAR